MSDPKNSSIQGDGFRFYRWEPIDGSEPTDVLSVTSIRKLCGEPYNLVNWQLANLTDVALGTMKRTVIGPRGGVKEVRQVWEYPCEFAQRYDDTGGEQSQVDSLRKWLREQADAPRNIAAIRGTMVHRAIENNIAWDRIERPYVESVFAEMSQRDRAKMKSGISDEDVHFVRNGMRQYWDMRKHVPFIIIAREPQVFNLTAGYAGSADALGWLLPEGLEGDLPKAKDITLKLIKEIGGETCVLDWKTSTDVYTDHVTQTTAYMSGEFIGQDGIVDHRLTEILRDTKVGGLVHIRPNKWGVHLFDFEQDVLRAFLGACAFARFLAKYPSPKPIFTREFSGEAPETE
jgi:hypothetical protein